MYEQREASEKLLQAPAADIFIAHNSPRGTHEIDDHVHQGFDGLKKYVEENRPKILFHGHQHVDKETQVENTRVIGVYDKKRIEIPLS